MERIPIQIQGTLTRHLRDGERRQTSPFTPPHPHSSHPRLEGEKEVRKVDTICLKERRKNRDKKTTKIFIETSLPFKDTIDYRLCLSE